MSIEISSGWDCVGSIRSSFQFIHKICNTMRALPFCIQEILFRKSIFNHTLCLHYPVPRPFRPPLKRMIMVLIVYFENFLGNQYLCYKTFAM